MAKKMDMELVNDTRQENRNYQKKTTAADSDPQTEKVQDPIVNASRPEEPVTEPVNTAAAPVPDTEQEEFKKKFEEYFKGAGSMITGSVVTEMIDDLKANLLMIYAKKSGVDLEKDAFKMDQKSKELTAFLIDHAVKNKFFDWMQKYPLVAAGGVFALSGASSYLFIQMMKKNKDENERLKEVVQKLKRKVAENQPAAPDPDEELEADPDPEPDEAERVQDPAGVMNVSRFIRTL